MAAEGKNHIFLNKSNTTNQQAFLNTGIETYANATFLDIVHTKSTCKRIWVDILEIIDLNIHTVVYINPSRISNIDPIVDPYVI